MRLSRHKLRVRGKKLRFGRRTALEILETRINFSHDGVESGPYIMPADLQTLLDADASAAEGLSSPSPLRATSPTKRLPTACRF